MGTRVLITTCGNPEQPSTPLHGSRVEGMSGRRVGGRTPPMEGEGGVGRARIKKGNKTSLTISAILGRQALHTTRERDIHAHAAPQAASGTGGLCGGIATPRNMRARGPGRGVRRGLAPVLRGAGRRIRKPPSRGSDGPGGRRDRNGSRCGRPWRSRQTGRG